MTSRRATDEKDKRIKELEEQVAYYKRRLDELRRAKNTTILKREQKYVEVTAPSLGRRDSKNEESKFSQDVETKSDAPDRKENTEQFSCNHEEEIQKLSRNLDAVTADNAALVVENQELKERVENLTHELSVKEATWCETEEQLNLKLKMEWGEKYREWMGEMERKVDALQQTNVMLNEMLNRSRPAGPDPSRQDPR